MHESALLAAIRDEPEDDLPRLAYADWCEEQGNTDRAEFIRAQVELSHGVRDRGRSVELLRRLRELNAAHRAEWLGPLRKWAAEAIFERGLVAYLSLSAADFLAHGREILAAHPVTRLHLHGAADLVADLAAGEFLAGMTALDLRENPLGDRGAITLAGSPGLARLRFLDLRTAGVGAAGARALASSPHLGELTSLDLGGNSLGDEGVEAFTGAMRLPKLARLDLSRNNLTSASARCLAACGKLGTLEVLRLPGNHLLREDIALLAGSPALARVRVLDVKANTAVPLGDEFGPRVVY